jgi:hypothetical protein
LGKNAAFFLPLIRKERPGFILLLVVVFSLCTMKEEGKARRRFGKMVNGFGNEGGGEETNN